jgi:7-keto-8-aminopelargonate synthetase-like enzyme
VSVNYGDVCPLRDIVELKNRFKFRVMLMDQLGFGVMGESGRGTHEELGVPISDIDMYMGSLEGGIGAVGGFVAGSRIMVDHQRCVESALLTAVAPLYAAPPGSTVCSTKLIKHCWRSGSVRGYSTSKLASANGLYLPHLLQVKWDWLCVFCIPSCASHCLGPTVH